MTSQVIATPLPRRYLVAAGPLDALLGPSPALLRSVGAFLLSTRPPSGS
jgi:hypothetical protein